MVQLRWDATTIRLLGLGINTTASIIMTLHVTLIHRRYEVNSSGAVVAITNDRENIEHILMYCAVGFYIISFFLFVWSAFLEQANRRKEFYLLEKYFNVDFSDLHGVSIDDVEDFEAEKQRGFTIRKAKDVLYKSPFEVHKTHTNIND